MKTCLILLLVVIIFCSCGGDTKDDIVGRWELVAPYHLGSKHGICLAMEIWEFGQDNQLSIEFRGEVLSSGTYSLIDGNTVEITYYSGVTLRYSITFLEGNSMELEHTDSEGRTILIFVKEE